MAAVPSFPDADSSAVALSTAHALHRQGLLAEAEVLYRQILQSQPQQVDALQLLALIEAQNQRPAEAIALFDAALALRPDLVSAWVNRGVALQALKRTEAAVASYERALALQPGHVTALFNRAAVLQQLKRNHEALAGFDAVLRASPQNEASLFSRSVLLLELGRYAEALGACESCLALKPDSVDSLIQQGKLLTLLGRADQGLRSFDRVVQLDPGHSDALHFRGFALQQLGRHLEARDSYVRACALRPDHAKAQRDEGLCALLLGDFVQGWRQYEWRFNQEERVAPSRDFGVPRWHGTEALEGRTILLHFEQGLGDTIQFCRYAKALAQQGARVILEVQEPLKSVLAQVEGVHSIIAHGEPLPTFDLYCPLLSLPLAFGTDLSSIPAPAALRAGERHVAAWKRRLGKDTRPRVGLVWSGNSFHISDQSRSIPLADFSQILCEGAAYCSLQTEVREADRLALKARPEIRICSDQIRDFSDTAALIEAMDLVITVDTSVAHLAGSMGKPVWILLPANPDWRWMLERDDSPWYPTARLFRQPEQGDWSSVLHRVREALVDLVERDERQGAGG